MVICTAYKKHNSFVSTTFVQNTFCTNKSCRNACVPVQRGDRGSTVVKVLCYKSEGR